MTSGHHGTARIHVCSLAILNDVVHEHAASHVMTVINPWSVPDTPPQVATGNHLKIAINDIEESQPGLVAPDATHIEQIVSFADTWDRQHPMVIHCLAGISRSTAAAFITVCALNPAADESQVARTLRNASESASPNRLMIELADNYLDRNGRMIDAIEAIGPGQAFMSATPFSIPSSMT